ncbi:MAG: UDP-glucose/GDP-mannose dehydrogenase family protein [Candidatus Saelkia tenebricola]|nr:UDP-glucose/GDP-mannose dehydrogenase family protein [Candidatus Saelkia tenebricola]
MIDNINVSVIGCGYVGLVTGACLADVGYNVLCMDVDESKIKMLDEGEIPIYEPGLEDIVKKNKEKGRLRFSSSLEEAVLHSVIIFIAVGTPPKENGEADLSYVENVARQIALSMKDYRLIVEKSTVPVETGEKVAQTMNLYIKKDIDFDVASNPEFLREGSAINDFLHPDRIVVGVDSDKAKDLLTRLYEPLNAEIIVTDIKSAELIKHASNSFLAAKISFINAVSHICEKVGADVEKVAEGMGWDKRIGKDFLRAGIGYGGSCFPKDVDAFIHISEVLGYDFTLLKEVRKINAEQRRYVLEKIKNTLWILKGKKIAIWGASFKPDTDDVRGAPVVEIIELLIKEGANISVYDPQALSKLELVFGDKINYVLDKYQAVEDADCVFLATEWDEFKDVDFVKLKKIMHLAFIVDGRNLYHSMGLEKLGFVYIPFGKSIKSHVFKKRGNDSRS